MNWKFIRLISAELRLICLPYKFYIGVSEAHNAEIELTNNAHDAAIIDDTVVNEKETIENQPCTILSRDVPQVQSLEDDLSHNILLTPQVPSSLRTGLKGCPRNEAKLRENLDWLLTPLRENISRICTPMGAAHPKNLSSSHLTATPLFTWEHVEDNNKTRFIVEVPTNLLDVSVTTLDNMFSVPQSNLVGSLTYDAVSYKLFIKAYVTGVRFCRRRGRKFNSSERNRKVQ